MKIELTVANLGHVPSFKNKKRAIRLKAGGQMLVTEKKTKLWMQDCIHSFGLQLNFLFQINAAEMQTDAQARSLIASLLPLDDSRQWIPEQHIYCEEVDKGSEGATITIERL